MAVPLRPDLLHRGTASDFRFSLRVALPGISPGNFLPAPGTPLPVKRLGIGSAGVDNKAVFEGFNHALAN